MRKVKSFLVYGGKKLFGTLKVQTSKNATLPILAGSLLCEGEVTIKNYPKISDIDSMLVILESLGVEIIKKGKTLILNAQNANKHEVPKSLASVMRSSVFLMGAVIAKCGKVKLAYPGGCAIGTRPIDIHINAFKELGMDVCEQENMIVCDGTSARPNDIFLRFPSVGATENIMLATAKLSGITRIVNAAKEPEIVDLQNYLNAMGCKVVGAGTETITIVGVKETHSVTYTPISDRIVAGTYLIATAICGGIVKLLNVCPSHNLKLLEMLEKAGCKLLLSRNSIEIHADKKLKCIPYIQTGPYDEFPTDLQSQIMALQCVSYGNSIIYENVFENRFKTAEELCKLGAHIVVCEQKAKVFGVKHLKGTLVNAKDLRGGASLVIAGLVAKNVTQINNVEYIFRGYEHIDKDLIKLGAKIERI